MDKGKLPTSPHKPGLGHARGTKISNQHVHPNLGDKSFVFNQGTRGRYSVSPGRNSELSHDITKLRIRPGLQKTVSKRKHNYYNGGLQTTQAPTSAGATRHLQQTAKLRRHLDDRKTNRRMVPECRRLGVGARGGEDHIPSNRHTHPRTYPGTNLAPSGNESSNGSHNRLRSKS